MSTVRPTSESSAATYQEINTPCRVKFANVDTIVQVDQIDDQMKEEWSCSSIFWTTLKVAVGIVIFPLGLYWLICKKDSKDSADCSDPSKPILKPEGTQHPHKGGEYEELDYRRVYRRTKELSKQGFYVQNGNQISIKSFIRSAKRGTVVCQLDVPSIPRPDFYSVELERTEREAIDVAIEELLEDHTVVLLLHNDLGEVKRRSAFSRCVKQHEADEYLFIPNVPFFRKGKRDFYAYEPVPSGVPIITSAQDLSVRDRAVAQLETAIRKGFTHLVLSPPEEEEDLYRELLENEYKGMFIQAIFAK